MRQEKRIPRHPQKRKSPFPAETAEKRRFGAVPLLLISQGAYTKMEIKKPCPTDKGAIARYHPALYSISLTRTDVGLTALQFEAPRGHAFLPYRFPSSRLSVISGQAQSCSSPLIFTKHYNSPRSSCQEGAEKEK